MQKGIIEFRDVLYLFFLFYHFQYVFLSSSFLARKIYNSIDRVVVTSAAADRKTDRPRSSWLKRKNRKWNEKEKKKYEEKTGLCQYRAVPIPSNNKLVGSVAWLVAWLVIFLFCTYFLDYLGHNARRTERERKKLLHHFSDHDFHFSFHLTWQTDRQTDRRTDRQVPILFSLPLPYKSWNLIHYDFGDDVRSTCYVKVAVVSNVRIRSTDNEYVPGCLSICTHTLRMDQMTCVKNGLD